jgi:chemosensory pili system protein ChpA (sensor histidine kinase/response regulator)
MAFKTILIVEDDLSIRTSLKLLFEGDGYPVLLAKHGQEALDLLEKSPTSKIGLILLDFMMPVMDGPTFLLKLQRNHPEILSSIPIFIITAANIDTHRVTIKTTGLLKKPFDMKELFSVVTRYCGG